MDYITAEKLKQFRTVLSKAGLADDKDAIVRELTNGRTASSKELYPHELQPWLDAMNQKPRTAVQGQPHPGDKMIRSIIAMAREMGVITRRQQVNAAGQMEWKSDYTAFNQWLLHKSSAKKPNLNSCTVDELQKLVTQYKAIYMDWIKKYR